jgi:ATP-dependent Clp protease adaptor protein ClpS
MSTPDLKTKTRTRVARPKQFVVMFHNDDFTPFDFVIAVMTDIFKIGIEEAERLTMTIHKDGSAAHGPMTHEIAETRATLAMDWAKSYELPFKCTVEEA